MSLLDTIKAARQEAEDAGTLLSGAKKTEAEAAADAQKSSSRSRRSSAASAKPTRELAGTVRASGAKPANEMSKEEKKAAREARRQEEDVIYDAKKVVLEQMPEYKHTQRVWWAMLISGIVCTLISWATVRMINAGTLSSGLMATSVVLMVVAYVLVIGAFIYDLVKVRPLRNKANDKLTGMSKRRMRKVVADDEQRRASEKAAKGKK